LVVIHDPELRDVAGVTVAAEQHASAGGTLSCTTWRRDRGGTLRQLRERGLITLSGHRVVIHHPEKLRDLAEYNSSYLDQSYTPI
jgi:hypothetical protein